MEGIGRRDGQVVQKIVYVLILVIILASLWGLYASIPAVRAGNGNHSAIVTISAWPAISSPPPAGGGGVPPVPAPSPPLPPDTTPATFNVSDLSIAPTEVDIGETVNITILLTNTGGQSGSYEVTLRVNGIIEASKKVTLAAGDSELVSFSTIKNTAGTYSLEVDGLTGSFTVKEKPVAPPTTQPPTNWLVIGGIIAAIGAAVGLIYLLLYKRII